MSLGKKIVIFTLLCVISINLQAEAPSEPLTVDFVRKYLKDFERVDLIGREVQLKITQELNPDEIHTVFELTKRALGVRAFKRLKWKNYKGSVIESQVERELLLLRDENGVLLYKGLEGYLKYAELQHQGRLKIAHLNMRAVLSASEIKELDWKVALDGFADIVRLERNILLDTDAEGKLIYSGIDGYIRYTEEGPFAGDMQAAFLYMSSRLTAKEKQKLGWVMYPGFIQDLMYEIQLLTHRGADGQLTYAGIEGYFKYAELFFGGNLDLAMSHMMAALNKSQRWELNWGKRLVIEISQLAFDPGAEPEKLGQILDRESSDNKVLKYKRVLKLLLTHRNLDRLLSYADPQGHARFSERFFAGDRKAAFNVAQAVLNSTQWKALGWIRAAAAAQSSSHHEQVGADDSGRGNSTALATGVDSSGGLVCQQVVPPK